jgi:hypothetical protein
VKFGVDLEYRAPDNVSLREKDLDFGVSGESCLIGFTPMNAPDSPQPSYAISVERQLVGNKREAFEHGLRDQHAIERVSVRSRQCAADLPMSNTDGQSSEALIR